MTPFTYGPFADRRGVAKTAKKLSRDFCCDAFVIEVGHWRFRAFTADFPGDRPVPELGRIVEEFLYVPPLPVDPETGRLAELLNVIERLHYEVNGNPAPEGDGGLSAEGLTNLVGEALDLGLLETIRRLV